MSVLEKFDPDNDGYFPILRNLICIMGDDPDRPELKDTPSRVLKSYKEMFAGYAMNPEEILKTFEVGNMPRFQNSIEEVSQRNIPFVSFCEHHLLPFFGTVDISYVPIINIRVGLSKLTRLVECFSKRLQVQERMTNQILVAMVQSKLTPKEVVVTSNARHMCMECRGVQVFEVPTQCQVRWTLS